MNSDVGAEQTTANDPVSEPDRDAAFKAWLSELRFVIEPAELGRVRAAFEQLAGMNRMNRASLSRRGPGGDV
jgi:hypothetical protein